jgi:hypothetical protein
MYRFFHNLSRAKNSKGAVLIKHKYNVGHGAGTPTYSNALRSYQLMNIYSIDYTGYVYIWYDTIAKFFYIGGHYGKVEDSYICSSKIMKRAYKIRPNTFKLKILKYTNGNTKDLRDAEQKWLDLIKDSELMNTINVQNKTCKYYNVKKNAYGGSYKGHTKNRIKPSWNKGHTKEEIILRRNKLLCFITDKPKDKNIRNKKSKILKIKKERIPWNKGLTMSESFKKSISIRNKGKTAWNKGLPNPISAKNGKNGAAKLSKSVTGRKRLYRSDGTWTWTYPNT